MTALEPGPRALPQIGQPRYACDVRTGWHVQLPETGWALVLGVGIVTGGDIHITARTGLHEERTEQFGRYARLPTRTPQEQMQWIEAQRLDACGGGPVSRLHYRQQLGLALAEEILDEVPGGER